MAKEYFIYKGDSNFCSELEYHFETDSEKKSKPGGFYDVISEKDTIEGGIHVIEKSAYDALKKENDRLKSILSPEALKVQTINYNQWEKAIKENEELKAKLAADEILDKHSDLFNDLAKLEEREKYEAELSEQVRANKQFVEENKQLKEHITLLTTQCADLDVDKVNLEAERDELRAALEFYASRSVYEKLGQFPGDGELSECSDIARKALEGK